MEITIKGSIKEIIQEIKALSDIFLEPTAPAQLSLSIEPQAPVIHDIEEPEEKPKAKKVAKAKETKEEKVEEAPVVESELDLKTLQNTLQRVATKKGLGIATEIVKKYKAKTLRDLDPKYYLQFKQSCDEVLS